MSEMTKEMKYANIFEKISRLEKGYFRKKENDSEDMELKNNFEIYFGKIITNPVYHNNNFMAYLADYYKEIKTERDHYYKLKEFMVYIILVYKYQDSFQNLYLRSQEAIIINLLENKISVDTYESYVPTLIQNSQENMQKQKPLLIKDVKQQIDDIQEINDQIEDIYIELQKEAIKYYKIDQLYKEDQLKFKDFLFNIDNIKELKIIESIQIIKNLSLNLRKSFIMSSHDILNYTSDYSERIEKFKLLICDYISMDMEEERKRKKVQ